MKKWADFTEAETNAVKSAAVTLCLNAAGVTVTEAVTTALTSLFGSAITPYADAGVRCYWNPTEDGVVGIISVGRPYLPDIIAILRNFEGTFIPKYGRRTESETINKSGTEQVAIGANTTGTLDERITISAPDIKAATTGATSATEVDAAEKMRFDAETEKSLYLLFSKWVRRASVDEDV